MRGTHTAGVRMSADDRNERLQEKRWTEQGEEVREESEALVLELRLPRV